MTPTILTGSQVAAVFGVHPQTVIAWANSGRLPCFRTPGGHRRYTRADVDQLKAALTHEPAAVA